jgi:RecB family endonuclease NucS
MVSTGRIDISAQDKDGNVVVIELKAGTADRETIGQILGYMGALKNDPAMAVRGVIVAGEFDPAAVAALNVQPNLQLRQYSFNFSFKAIRPKKK